MYRLTSHCLCWIRSSKTSNWAYNILFSFSDNENNFIACLNSGETAPPLKTTFHCSAMTPEMCKRFCRGYGYSVAMLKRGTQCFCSAYSHVMVWNESRFSCSIPCSGNKDQFCGGKETYSAYRTMPGTTPKCFSIHIIYEAFFVFVLVAIVTVVIVASIVVFLLIFNFLCYF